jgi:hypothetical protein
MSIPIVAIHISQLNGLINNHAESSVSTGNMSDKPDSVYG